MVEKAKIFYFSVFVLVVFAFIFHVTAMGYNHWKKATVINSTVIPDFNYTTIGLFTRCTTSNIIKTETCFPNLYPGNGSCSWSQCLLRSGNADCQCDFLPSTKGIAACAIIAAVFLGLAIIILFIHSIKTSETRSIGLFLGLFPLFLLFFAFVFILIALILVGSYLSRDMMSTFQNSTSTYNTLGNSLKKSFLFYFRSQFGTTSSRDSKCIPNPSRLGNWIGNNCLIFHILIISSL